MSDDFDSHFQALAPSEADSAESKDDFESHFNQIAPEQVSKPAAAQYSNGPGIVAGAKRGAALASNALATGVRSAVEMPADVQDLGASVIGNDKFKPRNKVESALETMRDVSAHPIRSLNNALGIGMENRPDLVPEGAAEKYGVALTEALPNALTLAAGGGMGAARALAVTGAGAVGAQGAKDFMPDNKYAPIIGGVVSSLLAGWGTGAIKTFMETRAATKAAEAAHSAYKDAVEAARAGRYDATTGVANIKAESSAILNTTKDMAADSVSAAEQQAQDSFETAAKSWGTSVTPQQAGEKLQDAARGWMTKTFPEKMAALRAPLDKAIPATTPVELSQFDGVLAGINKKAGSLQPLVDVLTKAMPRQLAKAGDAAAEAEGLITSGPTWGEARTLRSTIGDAMKDPELVSKIGESNLQALYKAVTADLTKTAKGAGAEDVWKAFNEGSTKLHNFATNTLGKVISATDKAQESINPEEVATALLSGAKKGGSDLAALQRELPGAVSELTSAQLVQGGKAWNSLSKEAQAILVPDKVQRAALNTAHVNTETATDNAKEVVKQANREHAEALIAAQADARAGNFDRSTAIVEARQKAAEAAAKVKPKNSMEGIQETLAGMKRSAFGVLASNALGSVINNVPGGNATANMVAAMAPSVAKWGYGLIKNPRNAMIPAAGAVAGENALAPRPIRPTQLPS